MTEQEITKKTLKEEFGNLYEEIFYEGYREGIRSAMQVMERLTPSTKMKETIRKTENDMQVMLEDPIE